MSLSIQPLAVDAGGISVHLAGAPDSLNPVITTQEEVPGVYRISIALRSEEAEVYPALRLSWSFPAMDIHGLWHPTAGRNRSLPPDWSNGFPSMAAYSAPVVCLFNNRGANRLTFAFSDVLNSTTLQAGVHEESAHFHCSVILFEEPGPKQKHYEAELRLDTRTVPYADALHSVGAWWSSLPGCEASPVPDAAREPMYSTWYSFHQELSPVAVEEQGKLAQELGCRSVIVDDGWQTSDQNRGYAYCGDWRVSPDKIPDMRAHVERVHELGMNYLLWYSVPFIGRNSAAWEAFRDKLLDYNESMAAGVLDPRYPEVREYLIRLYERALIDWNLDGFKLDFMDMFKEPANGGYHLPDGTLVNSSAGRDGKDTPSVPEAVERLLEGIHVSLGRIKPDVLIEFRQNYIGPLMRKYGNMFRAADCPYDGIENRLHTIDLRLLAGNTAVHSDMLMWNLEETPECAALQLLNVLFSVPQISVRLDLLPESHRMMLAFWLGFWRENRDVLLDGRLEPQHPELLYPLVVSRTADKLLAAFYQDVILRLDEPLPPRLLVVNGTLLDRLVFETSGSEGPIRLEVRNCMGDLVRDEVVTITPGLHRLAIPPAGCAVWHR
ncbi:glycoside hydrolase family 36 protein [Gorillibacterium timonense]|uniref:glycoside hydrolase family 36 protein n=1 Tax=Gorillibacterium timonense TaxID=1689269 RepID=UPI00071C66F3|nr:glycoside hydrolase family 36 protein [Gorillibacterium timonense]